MNSLVWFFTAVLVSYAYNLILGWFANQNFGINFVFALMGAGIGGLLCARFVPDTPPGEWHFDAFNPGAFLVVVFFILLFLIVSSAFA